VLVPALPEARPVITDENSRHKPGCVRQSDMNHKIFRAVLGSVLLFLWSTGPIQATEPSNADAALRKAGSFALGGVGVAGTMSEGERALREVLKDSDTIGRLESMLPTASPAGQLYALLGLRLRDRAAYQRALQKYRANDATVPTMRGCILQRESFRDLVKQIDHGDYDSFLAREWPDQAR
jgi:hypothetical protein